MSDGELRSAFRSHLREFDWLSVETPFTSLGVPDSNFCCRGIEGWIEYKRALHWRVRISPEQVGWAERRARNGGRVFLAVRRDMEELWLYDSTGPRKLINGDMRKNPPLAMWKAPWDWDEIKRVLLR